MFDEPATDRGPVKALPWERQEGEPALWYYYFYTFYLPLSPDRRSIAGAYNALRATRGKKPISAAPRNWYKRAKEWRWQERAEAHDQAERERSRRELEQERAEWRRRRRYLLHGMLAKVAQAVDAFDPEAATPRDVVQAVAMVVDQLRSEYDEQPVQRVEAVDLAALAGQLGLSPAELARLSERVQQHLLRVLQARPYAGAGSVPPYPSEEEEGRE